MSSPKASFQKADSRKMRTRNMAQAIPFDAVSIHPETSMQPSINNALVQDCPEGYPLLAAFLDSDDNFMMYRRFGYLQARLLLEKQEQLRRFEEDLDILDREDKGREGKDANGRDNPLRTLKDGRKEKASERRVLMRKIEKKFRDYGTLISSMNS
jgi:hypothetical protein